MLARIGKRTGLRPDDLRWVRGALEPRVRRARAESRSLKEREANSPVQNLFRSSYVKPGRRGTGT